MVPTGRLLNSILAWVKKSNIDGTSIEIYSCSCIFLLPFSSIWHEYDKRIFSARKMTFFSRIFMGNIRTLISIFFVMIQNTIWKYIWRYIFLHKYVVMRLRYFRLNLWYQAWIFANSLWKLYITLVIAPNLVLLMPRKGMAIVSSSGQFAQFWKM